MARKWFALLFLGWILLIVGFFCLLYANRDTKLSIYCPDGWPMFRISQEWTVYVPNATENISQWNDQNPISSPLRFHTVILDCPTNNTPSATGNATAEDFMVALTSAKQKADVDAERRAPVNIWLKHSGLGLLHNNTYGNKPCVEFARQVNILRTGTVQGILLTDETLLRFRKSTNFLKEDFSEVITQNSWKMLENKTTANWKNHGLLAGLMITNSSTCRKVQTSVPAQVLESFDQSFVPRWTACCHVTGSRSIFHTMTLFKSLDTCQKYLDNKLAKSDRINWSLAWP